MTESTPTNPPASRAREPNEEQAMKPLTDAEAEALIEILRNEGAWRASLSERRERIASELLVAEVSRSGIRQPPSHGFIAASAEEKAEARLRQIQSVLAFADLFIAELDRKGEEG